MNLLIDVELLDFRSENSINVLQSLLVLLVIILQNIHLCVSLFSDKIASSQNKKASTIYDVLSLFLYFQPLFFSVFFYLIIMFFIQQTELLDSSGVLQNLLNNLLPPIQCFLSCQTVLKPYLPQNNHNNQINKLI